MLETGYARYSPADAAMNWFGRVSVSASPHPNVNESPENAWGLGKPEFEQEKFKVFNRPADRAGIEHLCTLSEVGLGIGVTEPKGAKCSRFW